MIRYSLLWLPDQVLSLVRQVSLFYIRSGQVHQVLITWSGRCLITWSGIVSSVISIVSSVTTLDTWSGDISEQATWSYQSLPDPASLITWSGNRLRVHFLSLSIDVICKVVCKERTSFQGVQFLITWSVNLMSNYLIRWTFIYLIRWTFVYLIRSPIRLPDQVFTCM